MYEIPDRPADEVARLGEEVYEREVRPRVGAEHAGRYLVLDVETGDYEVGDRALEATRALRERRPWAVTYLVRVGPGGESAPAYRLGGRSFSRSS